MYCQECYQKLPDSANVCPMCHYNNSPNLSQPNILFGKHKDNPLEIIEINLNGTEQVGVVEKIKRAVSAAFKGDSN